MKFSHFFLAACIGLAGCSSSTIGYDLSFKQTDPALQEELVYQSVRVIDRRLDALETAAITNSVSQEDGTYRITVAVKDQAILDFLTMDLTSPFTFDVMTDATEEEADLMVEGHGGFKRTQLTEQDLQWAQARKDPDSTKGEVRLIFSPEGRTKLAAIFTEARGKSIGLFVRDRLISKLLVESDDVQEDIVIRDIPDPEMAQVFADDVNVGINVTFTPIQ